MIHVNLECATIKEMADSIIRVTVADLEGPILMDFFSSSPFCMRMLKNKAQIARESIKNPRELPGSSGPWIPAVRDFGLRARDVRART